MKILIAEDDLVSRSFLSRFLRDYGPCDLVADGHEALDAFLMAWKDQAPYQLICLDVTMPKADGMKILKGIRDLEKQFCVAPENRVNIIMTTVHAQTGLVRKAFDDGCDAYATKPIDTRKLVEVMEKLGLVGEQPRNAGGKTPGEEAFDDISDVPAGYGVRRSDTDSAMPGEEDGVERCYFKGVRALPEYQLEVMMETGSTIRFDFRSRLNTARFGRLRDRELFASVRTDGNRLLFENAGRMPVKITASEFMDLVLIDRRR